MDNYLQKYLKYKQKYLNLYVRKQIGGYNHEDRSKKYNYIKKILSCYRDINTQRYCIGDTHISTVAKLVTLVSMNNFISSGSNGEVYNATIKDINIAVKKQPLTLEQNSNIMVTSNVYNTESWAEIYAMMYGNELFENNITPHISLLYGYFICDACTYTNPDLKRNFTNNNNNNCVYIINELASGDMYKWCTTQHDDHDWYIMLFQVIYSLLAYHYTYGLSHGDLHAKNILYEHYEPSETYNTYKFFDHSFNIKNNGFLFKLYDFAKAKSPEILNYTYTNDNLIIHRNKDILKFVDNLIYIFNDPIIIIPSETIYYYLLEIKTKLLIDCNDLHKTLETIIPENYISTLDNILIYIGSKIHNDTETINHTYGLTERAYYSQEELNSELKKLKLEIQTSIANQATLKNCHICTYENQNCNTNCEMCGTEI